MSNNDRRVTDEEALAFHAEGRPGKLGTALTKPMMTQRDLSLAYSPGVAVPCLAIHKNPDTAYDYTTRGNMVAVISNGTAVLGLGNLGALASKPVMEGKAALFKRFADVDCIDLEVATEDVEEFINCVRFLGPSFGGINLEDIKSPECFIIEQRLREVMDIPVFHDDQHGTAIIATAGLINALHLTKRDMKNTKMVMNGAGAAAIACAELFKSMGFPASNITMCDTEGVIYKGRTTSMNQWKSGYAIETKDRTLLDAMRGADVFVGLSVKGCVTAEMVKSMAKNPIIFAMANPDPEITPEQVKEIRGDVIMATGRSDYPNQVNNVLGFPYIFRGALDVRARTINDEMKIAAATALAELARQDVPDEVSAAYGGRRLRYGPEYIIPVPFDPRLITEVPMAVAKAAMDSGVAGKPIKDFEAYHRVLRARFDPTADSLEMIYETVRQNPSRVVFAEGEEERTIRAALQFQQLGYGEPVLIGREEVIQDHLKNMDVPQNVDIEIHNAALSTHNEKYAAYLYGRLQRQGHVERDCNRLINHDRNIFAASMVAMGDADAMVTGLTRSFVSNYEAVRRVIDAGAGGAFGLSIAMMPGRTLFLADTAVSVEPSAERLAEIATQSSAWAHRMGHQPRVAFLSFANFGQGVRGPAGHIREALQILDSQKVNFEYEGEMSADVALDYDLMKRAYPFARLTGAANVLVMPNLQAANIAAKLLHSLPNVTLMGPVLHGLKHPVQIVRMGASAQDMLNSAVIAAYQAVLMKK